MKRNLPDSDRMWHETPDQTPGGPRPRLDSRRELVIEIFLVQLCPTTEIITK